MSLVFKISPVRKQPYIDYSLWLYDLYNYYFKDNHNGFLVELGVGKTIDWVSMGEDSRILTDQEFKEKYVRGWSNTIELLENGWSGIYVEPITEFLTNELTPLLKQILTPEQFLKVKMCPYAASDKEHIAKIIDFHDSSIYFHGCFIYFGSLAQTTIVKYHIDVSVVFNN